MRDQRSESEVAVRNCVKKNRFVTISQGHRFEVRGGDLRSGLEITNLSQKSEVGDQRF